jgi:thiamine biosynthesis lipoprotein
MGTTWSLQYEGDADIAHLQSSLQKAVQEVDDQMSTWTTSSNLMQFNAAPCGEWIALPHHLMTVLAAGQEMTRLTNGAFEMNLGDAVQAWGFCSKKIDLAAIRAASAAPWVSSLATLDLNQNCARKTAPLALDLSGIAKGYGVDRLAEVAQDFGLTRALCDIDGELRAMGEDRPWTVAIESPDSTDRAAHSFMTITKGALATSGDYRHFVMVKGQRLSHTIDPRRRAPVVAAPASVTVMAETCIQADAMATALLVMGAQEGLAFAKAHGISALFLIRGPTGIEATGTGILG